MALRYLIVTQFIIQVIFAFSPPRGFGCQNIQNNCLNRQLRTNRCRRQDSPPVGLPANDNTINGFANSLPFRNGMPFGNVPFRNRLPNGFGLNNGLPMNNGLPNGLPISNGLPNGMPMNTGLPNALPINNFPNSASLNSGLTNELGLYNGFPMNNRFPLNVSPNNGFPTNVPSPNFNAPTNGFLPTPNGINNGFFNPAPNGLPINISPLNGFQNINTGIANNMPNLNNFPANNIIPNVNNMPSYNNLQSVPPNIDGQLGNGQVFQSGLSNNFQNTFPVNNVLPNNNPQINNIPDGLPNTNLPLANSIPIQNELPNLNNMQFTFIPRRFDNIPDNNFYNNNNLLNGNPEINTIQNNNGHQFNNVVPYNNFQPSNLMTEQGQLAPLNGFPNVNHIPENAINPVPLFNNWGIANNLPTRNVPIVSPEMFLSNLQYDFNTPNMQNQLPYSGLPLSNMPIDFQSVLPNNPGLNTLRIEGFGNLPIINGFPVAGITETVTLLNGQL